MGLGILEPHAGDAPAQVPGTATLLHDDEENVQQGDVSKNSAIILVPKPSNSPRDPLNWPVWKKDLALLAMCLSITVGGIQDSLLSTVNGVLAPEFGLPIEKIENLSSYPLLASGVTCGVASILARIVGKRPIYVASTSILLITCVWSALIERDYDSFFAARLISGIGLGSYEALVLSSIGDMYFVHQRGKRVAFLNIMSLGPINLSPILSGYVADRYNWRTNFWILTAFTAINLILVILFAPETQYERPSIYNTDIATTQPAQVEAALNPAKEEPKSPDLKNESATATAMEPNQEEPLTYWQELKPYSGLRMKENPWRHITQLFACATYPAVIWTFLVGGTYSGWFSGLSITIAQIFSVPPTSYTPTQLGHLNTFPALGAFLAFAVLSLLADSTAKYAARRNNRIYEPEFRLYLIGFGLFVGVPGLALFGWYAGTAAPTPSPGQNGQDQISWVVVSFLYGMIIFTTVTQQSTSFAYLLDAHRNVSIETAVFVVMVRNFFSFAAGKFLPAWLNHSGTAKTFYAIAGIQAALVLTTVPLYVFGKIIRSVVHRW